MYVVTANGPFFDEVHGIYHLFYQDHLAMNQSSVGIGPVWAHVVSRDLARWARLGVALWNDQWYDKRAVFTGSVTTVGSKPYIIYREQWYWHHWRFDTNARQTI